MFCFSQRFGIIRNKKALYLYKAFTGFFCRGGQIRTDDLHIPNVARYRATLHPELSQKLRVQI